MTLSNTKARAMYTFLQFTIWRLSILKRSIYKRDYWWDFQNRTIAESSVKEVTGVIIENVLPWFNSFDSFDKMLSFVLSESEYNRFDLRKRYEYACYVALAMGEHKKAVAYYNYFKTECEKVNHPSSETMINMLSLAISTIENETGGYNEQQIQETSQALKLSQKLFA